MSERVSPKGPGDLWPTRTVHGGGAPPYLANGDREGASAPTLTEPVVQTT
ncbi:MAG: hypothetical protein QXE79_08540 [Candidatus Bathyarchaeia archaeon]